MTAPVPAGYPCTCGAVWSCPQELVNCRAWHETPPATPEGT